MHGQARSLPCRGSRHVTRTACASGRPKPPTAYNAYAKDYAWKFSHFRSTNGYVPPLMDADLDACPYLHNGSVPTLRDMLQRPDKRPKVFYRGYNVFEPRDIGFVWQGPQAETRRVPLRHQRARQQQRRAFVWDRSFPADKDALLELPENAIDRSPGSPSNGGAPASRSQRRRRARTREHARWKGLPNADYVIVGSGAGGGPARCRAWRSQDTGVVVLEAGGDPRELSGGGPLDPHGNRLPDDYDVPASARAGLRKRCVEMGFLRAPLCRRRCGSGATRSISDMLGRPAGRLASCILAPERSEAATPLTTRCSSSPRRTRNGIRSRHSPATARGAPKTCAGTSSARKAASNRPLYR